MLIGNVRYRFMFFQKKSACFLVLCVVFFAASCVKIMPPQEYLEEQTACTAYNNLIKQEMNTIPDFSCPPVLVQNFFREGVPDNLQWYTSYPKNYASAGLKKGGKFYGYINDIPNTFRYLGPGVDEQCIRFFNTQMPFLYVSHETSEFMPCAAECWAVDSSNKTVYYKLYEKIFWSDGHICTADDWVFAWKFLCSKKIVDPIKNYRYNNLLVKKIDDFCVSVQYIAEQAYTDYELLDITNFKPIAEHFYNGEIPDNWIEKYNRVVEPTTGPYVLEYYDYNHGLKFAKVKNWWAHHYPHFAGIANFDEIYYRIIVGRKNPAFRKFALGLFDIIHLDNPSEWAAAEKTANVQEGFVNLWKGYYVPICGPSGMFFNTAQRPLNNKFIRKGLYYAVDIDGLISTAFSGKRNRMHTIGVGQNWGSAEFNNTEIQKPAFDPEKALEFFAKAGYDKFNSSGILINEKGEELSFTVLFKEERDRDIFGFLYTRALQAGVKIDFKYQSEGTLTSKIINRDYQAWWGTLPAYQIPNNYNFLHSSFAERKTFENFFGISNSEIDFLLEEFERSDLTYYEKADINRKIEAIVDEEALMIPAYYKNTISVMAWKWICFPAWFNMKYQNYIDDPMFGYMWFDADIEAECNKAKENNKLLYDASYSLSNRYKF